MHDHQRHVPVRVTLISHDYAEGGLVSEAEAVRRASRMGDSMVVHINKDEFEELRRDWGEPTINPETGMPEFFIKKLWKKAKKYVAPAAGALAGAFVPVIGDTLGSALPGLAGVIGDTGMQALGAGAIGAGIGAATNGWKGAALGALGGAAGAYAADAFGNLTDMMTGEIIPASAAAEAGLTAGGSGAVNWGGGLNTGAMGQALGVAALNMAGNYMNAQSAEDAAKDAKKAQRRAEAQFNKPLPVYTDPRRRREYTGVPDYTVEGEREYYDDNYLGTPVAAADGGHIMRPAPLQFAAGGDVPHGRSDSIEARLSEGEYVIDAETVALLGNGSNEAGAAALDRMRQNIRMHKGGALAAGAISPDAMPAEAYIGGMQ